MIYLKTDDKLIAFDSGSLILKTQPVSPDNPQDVHTLNFCTQGFSAKISGPTTKEACLATMESIAESIADQAPIHFIEE